MPEPAVLTAIGAFLLSLISLVVLPLVFRRQAAKQARALEEKQAMKEDAARNAALAANETVSWEKINQRLALTAQEERVAHSERLAEMRSTFIAEAERMKRLTDIDLDRAKAEIGRLGGKVQALEDQIRALERGDQ